MANFTLLLLVLAAAQAPGAAEPLAGRCHMGECSWSRELARETVRETPDGRLLRLRLLGGGSVVTEEGDYESAYDERRRIEWNEEPHEVFVFCSTRLPAVLFEIDGGLQVDVLDFVGGNPGYLESSATLYIATCHGRAALEETDFAERHGYRSAPPVRELELSSAEEIFDRLR